MRERNHEQHEAGERQRAAHHGERSNPIAKSAGEWSGDHPADAVGADRQAGERCRHVLVFREIENEKRQRHHPGAIHQRRGEDDPDVGRQAAKTAPGVEHERERKRSRTLHSRPSEPPRRAR